jgi:DNA-binding ferritin-like protein (Dps family)
VEPPEYNEILKKIDELPEHWNGEDKIHFNIITHRDEATWISSRIFEDVDRNLVSVKIDAKSSKYSIELDVVLTVIGGTVATKTIDLFLEELKNYLKAKWQKRQRKKLRRR